MANKFKAGMLNFIEVLNQMWDAFAAGPYNAVPLTGGTMTGGLTAPALQSFGPGAAQPRVDLGIDAGEPMIRLSRWGGFGTSDLSWRIKNDNGILRFDYSSVGSGADQVFVQKLAISPYALQVSVPLLADQGIYSARFPVAQTNTGAGAGWMKIAKIRLGSLGTDFVIRVSGTTSYGAIIGGSNGSVTTILGRIDNDNRVRGSVYTQGVGSYQNPSDVIFGEDGSVYMAAGQFFQLSVHLDIHSGAWEPQEVVYHSALMEPPAGNPAVKGWSLNLNGSPTFVIGTANIDTVCNFNGRNVTPTITNTYALGSGAYAYTTAYLSTGSINASDARMKCDFRDLTPAEIKAAGDIARAIGVYRWKDSVAAKASDAREHIGPTVQKAIEIMQSHGLDPFNYGFICHDEWEREVIEHPAVGGLAAIPPTEEVPAQLDKDGNVLVAYVPANPGQPAMEGREAYTEVVRQAGDRYAFRYDELAMFIAVGQAAQRDALEQRIAALEAA